MRREDFTQFGSVFVLAGIVVLSLIMKYILRPNPNVEQPVYMVYPAYETANPDGDEHIDKINGAMPFMVNTAWPEGWKLKTEGTLENLPDVQLYTPYYIYDGETQIGYAVFDVFEPLDKDVPMADYHKYVWDNNKFLDNYEDVRTLKEAEFGICQVNDGNTRAMGVIACSKDVSSYTVMVVNSDALDRDTAIKLCLKMSISSQ